MLFIQLAWVQFLSQVFVTEGKVLEFKATSDYVRNLQTILDPIIETKSYISIISSLEETKKCTAHEIVTSIIHDSSSTFTLNTFEAKNTMTLVIVDSFESFQKILNSLKVTNRSIFVIVFLENITSQYIQHVFEEFLMRNILEVYIIFESEESIFVVTFHPFSDKNCYNLSPVVVMSFTNGELVLNQTMETLTTFNNCPLRVGIYYSPPAIICKRTNCDLKSLEGRDIHLLKALSKSLNFSIEFEIYEEQQVKKSIRSLQENKSDFLIGDFFLRHHRYQVADVSVSYFSSKLGFIVPRGRPFTSFENLIMSFQLIVWMFLLATVLIGVFVIVVIKRQRKEVQAFVFGANIRSPMFNLAMIILGVSQKTLPRRNFARFLMMCFLMFCLVIRSLYQGAAYQFLKSHMHYKAVESIDDIVERGLLIYNFNETLEVLDWYKIDKDLIRSANSILIIKIFEELKDPYFGGVLVYPVPQVHYYNSIRKFNYTYEICKEILVDTPVVFYFKKKSFLADIFNDKLGHLLNSGLIDYWHNIYVKRNIEVVSAVPKTLTMTHLLGIFQIFCIGHLLALLIFIIEYLKAMIKFSYK